MFTLTREGHFWDHQQVQAVQVVWVGFGQHCVCAI